MLRLDLSQIGTTGDTFFSRADMGYLVFLIIGIFGYFTVPSVAGYIMFAMGGDAMTGKVSGATTGAAMGAAGMAAGGVAGIAKGPGAFLGGYFASDMEKNTNSIGGELGRFVGARGFMKEHSGGQGNSHQADKLKGDNTT